MPHSAEVNRRTLVTAGAWSVPVIALAVATPAAAASNSPEWTASQWVSRYRTDKQQLWVFFVIDQPGDELLGYSFSYSLAFASAPQTVVSWTPDSTAAGHYLEGTSSVDSYGPWPSGFPDPATMGEQEWYVTVTAIKSGESPIVLAGSVTFQYWDND